MLYKQHSNTGTPLIFVSGLFAGDWMWESTIAHLNKKKKYTIIQMIPPLAALGGTIEVLRERLLDIITVNQQAVVVGNSLGGLLALDIAARWPEHVLALVVSGAPGMGSVNLGIGLPKKGDKEWFLRLASKLFVDHNRISKDDIERTAIFFSDKRNFINMVRLARNADDYNIKPLLPKIRCPVLLVWVSKTGLLL